MAKGEAFFEWPNEIVPPIHFANHQWAVTDYGLECLTQNYPIERGRLLERAGYLGHDISDWVVHVGQKKWADIHEFCEAFERALDIHRVKGRTTVDISKSKGVALAKAGDSARFNQFVEEKLGSIAKPLGGGLESVCAADLEAAGQLYREEKKKR